MDDRHLYLSNWPALSQRHSLCNIEGWPHYIEGYVNDMCEPGRSYLKGIPSLSERPAGPMSKHISGLSVSPAAPISKGIPILSERPAGPMSKHISGLSVGPAAPISKGIPILLI